MKNNKYFLFCGESNTTGWDGFRGSFSTVDEAIQFVFKNYNYNWAEVVDVEQLKVVWTHFF